MLILNPLQAVAKSKCGKLLFSIIATTWQDVVGCSQPKPHVTALKASAIKPAWQDLSDDVLWLLAVAFPQTDWMILR